MKAEKTARSLCSFSGVSKFLKSSNALTRQRPGRLCTRGVHGDKKLSRETAAVPVMPPALPGSIEPKLGSRSMSACAATRRDASFRWHDGKKSGVDLT